MADDFDYIPEWGQLPVEKYIIRFWDPPSPQTPKEQRSTLDTTLFTAEPWIKPSRIPTEDEVQILQPWRFDEIRRIAWQIWGCNNTQPLLLRTYYELEHHESVNVDEWEELSWNHEEIAWWSILNNKEVFDFGADWQRVFQIFPEAPTQTRFRESLSKVKRQNKAGKLDLNTSLLRENPDAWDLLGSVSMGYILIVDKETLQTNQFLLVYFDWEQNVVAQGRISITEESLNQVLLDWFRSDPPRTIFEEGTIGEKYLVDGEIGRELYHFTKEELEDDPPMEG
ncbi:hypothetical protein BJX99DRAFT_247172 [Aspergillus californicus]